VVNCHLSGGAAPERRLRQVHEALDQIRKWKNKAKSALDSQRKARRPSPRRIATAEESLRRELRSGVVVCGDFNSDGDTAVRRLLVEGHVEPDWRENQYPEVALTSSRKSHSLGQFVDAAELAYGANVCDGDYGECPAPGSRPATYVVPDLAARLLLPVAEGRKLRTEFGRQVARSLADTLKLRKFTEDEIERAFQRIDLDENSQIDAEEIDHLVSLVHSSAFEREATADERARFLKGFGVPVSGGLGPAKTTLSRDQMAAQLRALQQELGEF